MKERIKTLSVQKLTFLSLILFYLPFHIFLFPDYWDDAVFAKVLNEYHYNLFNYTVFRYTNGSSRITIELILPFMAAYPNLWKVIDLFMIALLFFDLKWILTNIFKVRSQELDILLCFLLTAYPFSTMAQTGWVSTSMNYLWVIATGCYAINHMLKAIVLPEEKLSKKEIFFAIFAILYSASYESMAAILFVISIAIIVCCVKRKVKVPILVWCCIGVAVFMIIYIFCSPGNWNRLLHSDVENWMPEYLDMSFFDKIRVGILSTFMHFLSIPNAIFFILNFVVLLLPKMKKAKIVAALPLILDITWTGYYLLRYFAGEKFTYQVPIALPVRIVDKVEQGLLLISVLIWFAAVLYTIFQNLSVSKAILCVCILVLGCAPEMAVGVTSTVYASILRTTIYLYMAMIVLIICILSEIGLEKNTVRLKFLYFCMGCGVIMNACQITRHIIIYG